MKQTGILLVLLSMLIGFTGCEAIGAIFKTGVGVGIFIGVIILVLLGIIFGRSKK